MSRRKRRITTESSWVADRSAATTLEMIFERIPRGRELTMTRSECALLLRMVGFDPERSLVDEERVVELMDRFVFREGAPHEIRRPAFLYGVLLRTLPTPTTQWLHESEAFLALGELFGARKTLIDLSGAGREPYLRPEELVRFGHGYVTVSQAAALLQTTSHDLHRAAARGQIEMSPERMYVAAASVRDHLARRGEFSPRRRRNH